MIFLPKLGDPEVDQNDLTETFARSLLFKVPSLLIAFYGLFLAFAPDCSTKRSWFFVLLSLFYLS